VKICWHDLLQGCSAGEVFDYFRAAGLAAYRHRHHCLAALHRDKTGHAADTGGRTKSKMYTLYSMQRSGNSYKVRLALALLKAPYRAI
jgi:glutathione S-transferase